MNANSLGDSQSQKKIVKYIGDQCEILIDLRSDDLIQERNLSDIKHTLHEQIDKNVSDV